MGSRFIFTHTGTRGHVVDIDGHSYCGKLFSEASKPQFCGENTFLARPCRICLQGFKGRLKDQPVEMCL